jgi:hypothetical protein
MHNYLKATESLIEEFLEQEAGKDIAKNPEKLRAELALPDGDPEALRFGRRDNGELYIVAPWLLLDMFGI